MIKKMKKILIIPLLLFCVIQIVYGADWFRYASDHQKSFIYDSEFTGDFATADIIESSQYPTKISDYSPLVADLDDDGLREIIIVQNQEIRLFRGINYTLIDSFYDGDLTPLGQMEVVDFITGGNKELMMVVQRSNATISLFAINWDGSDFNISKEIDGVEESNGLNCDDIDSDDKVECVYFGYDGELYIYDEGDTSATSGYNDGVTDDCVDCSIPTFIDYDEDGDDDIFTMWGSGRTKVKKLRNDGGESFTFIKNWTYGEGVDQFAMIDLDGGQKEFVITHSRAYAVEFGCSGCTVVYVYGVIDNLLKCSYSDFLKFQQSPSVYASPELIGLRTCHGQGGDCDGGGDAYNDIWIVTAYSGGASPMGEEIKVLNWDGISSTCDLVYSSGLGTTSVKPTDYTTGVWANLDSDSDYEFLWHKWIFDNDGSLVRTYTTDPDMSGDYPYASSYFVVAEVTGDGTNDIIYQNSPTVDEIHVYSTHEPVCYDSDDGLTFLTKGYVINNSENLWDYCTDDILTEYYCFFDEVYTWDKDCTDYGSGYECIDGECSQEACLDSDGTNYLSKGYVDYLDDTYWDTCVKDPPYNVPDSTDLAEGICIGATYSVDLKDCKDYGMVWDCVDGQCASLNCSDSDGTNFFIGGTVYYNETLLETDFCVGDGVVEYTCPLVNGSPSETLKDCKDYGLEYGCTGGACSVDIVNCTDSDGVNYFNKGYVEDSNHTPIVTYDSCLDDNILLEYICSEDGLDVVEKECDSFGSLYGCYDGMCLLQPVNCTDSDGVDYFTQGYATDVIAEIDYWDFCYDLVTVTEFICSNEEVDTAYYQCSGAGRPYYCSEGRCISIANCTDTDDGFDYFTKGHTYFEGDCPIYSSLCDEWDVCIDGTNLVEYYCGGNATITGEQIPCPLGCYDGACIGDEEPSEEECFADSGISVCLVDRTSYPLCNYCDCYDLSYHKCPLVVNGTEVDSYESKLFNWDECESWQGSMLYSACPLYIWSVSVLDRIWNWVFGAFWVFLTLLLVIVIVLLIFKKITK